MNDDEATDLAKRILEESGRDVSVAGIVPMWSSTAAVLAGALSATAWAMGPSTSGMLLTGRPGSSGTAMRG